MNVLVPVPGELDQFELVTVCKLLVRVLIPRIVRDCGLFVGSIHLNVIDAFNCTLLVVDHGAGTLLISLFDLFELLDSLLEPVLELGDLGCRLDKEVHVGDPELLDLAQLFEAVAGLE